MSEKKSVILYLACAVTAAILWGFFAFPLRRIRQYPASEILYYRVFLSFGIVWLINLAFRKNKLHKDYQLLRTANRQSRNKFLWLLLASGIFITANWFTFIYVTNSVSLKAASFAYMICPLLTAAGGFSFLKENITRLKFLAIALAVSSITMLASASLKETAWSVLVASMYASYLVIQKVLSPFDKLNLLGINLLISVVLLLPVYLSHPIAVPANVEFWVIILIIAVILTIIPLLLSTYALNGIPSSTLGITIYINPAISFTVAVVWFHELVTAKQIAGYLLLMLAVITFNWPVISTLFKRKSKSLTVHT